MSKQFQRDPRGDGAAEHRPGVFESRKTLLAWLCATVKRLDGRGMMERLGLAGK